MTTNTKTTAGKASTGDRTATAGKARTRKTRIAATPEPVKFPASVLAYLQIAVEGPLGPGGVAHRVKRYPIAVINTHGNWAVDELLSGACLPTTTQPVPGDQSDNDEDEPNEQTIPVTICRSHGAAFAQAHGVTRCTQPTCFLLTAEEQPKAGTR